MSIKESFNKDQTIEGYGISITRPGQPDSVATFHGKSLALTPTRVKILAELTQKTDEGVTPHDLARMSGKNIETADDYFRTINTLKVHISHIRTSLRKAAPGIPTPEITPLYPISDHIHRTYRGEYDHQSYIMTPPIGGKPDYDVIREDISLIGRRRWETYVDVAGLSESPSDLRVYKRRVHPDWASGITCVGENVIKLRPLETSAVAQTILANGAPLLAIDKKLVFVFRNATEEGALQITEIPPNSYHKIVARAANTIRETTGQSSAAEKLLSLSGQQGSPLRDNLAATFG